MSVFRDIFWYFKVQAAKLKVVVKYYIRFFTIDIWDREMEKENLSRWGHRLISDFKILLLMFTSIANRKIGVWANSLSYLSVLAFVPMLAIVFWVAGDVGLDSFIRQYINDNLGDTSFAGSLIESADKIVATSQSGLFGFISMIALFSFVYSLMTSAGRAFNDVWMVNKTRPFFKELLFIFAILILSPFVLAIFFGGSFVYSHILDVLIPSETPVTAQIKSVLGWLLFAAISIAVISVMYKWIPTAKVRYRYALRAAIYSGLVFTVLQFLYLETQVMVANSSAIYGVIAAIPLFLVWLNWGWCTILFGAELSYSMQKVKSGDIPDEELDMLIASRRNRRKTANKDIANG